MNMSGDIEASQESYYELLNETTEQSKLLGMQAERELILLTKIERLERELAKLKNENN